VGHEFYSERLDSPGTTQVAPPEFQPAAERSVPEIGPLRGLLGLPWHAARIGPNRCTSRQLRRAVGYGRTSPLVGAPPHPAGTLGPINRSGCLASFLWYSKELDFSVPLACRAHYDARLDSLVMLRRPRRSMREAVLAHSQVATTPSGDQSNATSPSCADSGLSISYRNLRASTESGQGARPVQSTSHYRDKATIDRAKYSDAVVFLNIIQINVEKSAVILK
jgi:hypothetical protein